MNATPDTPVPVRPTPRSGATVLSAALLASGLLVLSFPVEAGGSRGGGSAPSRGGSGGSSSHSGGGRSSSGSGHSSSASARSSSGGRSYTAAAPRSSSSGGSSRTASPASSVPTTRSASGDRSSPSPGVRSGSAPRTYTATGARGGQGGRPPGGGSGGGHPGGGRPGGGHYGGGHHGWYCPPTYYGGSSWLWGGPWDWWWGWGWGSGWGWGGWGPYWGGVYVINDGAPVPNRYARVDTDVSPEAAEVFLDGTYIGSADDFDGYPDYLYLEPGKYRLEFRHPFYETLAREVEVRVGQDVSLNDELALLPGKKKLDAVDPERKGTPLGRVFGKPAAERTAAGTGRTGRFEVTGETDSGPLDDLDEIDEIDEDEDVLPPRRPAPPAGAEAWRSPEPKAGDVAPADQGRLRFEVGPGDAAVYVDDRYVGTGKELGGLTRGLRVNPGKHTVTVVRPGYGSKTVEVESRPGAAVDVVVELEK